MNRQLWRIFLDADDGAPPGGVNLIDNSRDEPPADGDTTPQIDLGGDDGRPGYVPEKFWDAKEKTARVESIMKSYDELERNYKRVEQGLAADIPKDVADYFTDAIVKDGKIVVPEGLQNTFDLKSDDPFLNQMAAKFQELEISPDKFAALVPAYLAGMDEAQGPPTTEAAEMEKLGPQAKSIMAVNTAFLDSALAQGTFTPEQHALASAVFGSSADAMSVLDALRVSAGHEPIPKGPVERMPETTEEELYERQTSDKYKDDAAFRAETDEMFARFYGTEPAGSSTPSGVGMQMAKKQDKKVLEEKYNQKRP